MHYKCREQKGNVTGKRMKYRRRLLSMPMPDAHDAHEAQDVETKGELDPSAFFGMIENVKTDFPNIKVVATTLREVHSTNRHSWSAVLAMDGKTWQAPTAELDVYDRIGGGDGFASGLFYGLMSGKEPEEALRLGWAHGALLTTAPGDTSMFSLDQVEAFAKGGSARVQR